MKSSKDLAELLGISPATVSMALNGRHGINEQTKQQVLEAAKKYGITKRERKSQNTAHIRFINLLVYKKHGLVFGDTPFFSAVIEGISNHARELGFGLQVSYYYANQSEEEQIKLVNSSGCSGVIVFATEMMYSDQNFLSRINLPIVILDSYIESAPYSAVLIDNTQGAYEAVKHLYESGHKNVGFIASSVEINNFRERFEGFQKAVSEFSGSIYDANKVIRVTPTTDGAYNDMIAFLANKPIMESAYFADNDIIASSCMRALVENGYKIPQDISMIGFDDMPISYSISPKLTTMHVPKTSLGRYAVSRLMEIIHDKNNAIIKSAIRTELVIRDSVYTA